ncbi:hypothetical protein BH18ACT4_BH18ACT4_03720 [soil metagenome]
MGVLDWQLAARVRQRRAPGLLREYQHRPASHRDVVVIDAASQPEGSVDQSVDPDLVLDLLVGSVVYRVFVLRLTGRVPPNDATAEILERAFRPPAG